MVTLGPFYDFTNHSANGETYRNFFEVLANFAIHHIFLLERLIFSYIYYEGLLLKQV